MTSLKEHLLASAVASTSCQRRLNTGMWFLMGYEQMQPIKLHNSVGQTADTWYFDCGPAAVHKTWHVVNYLSCNKADASRHPVADLPSLYSFQSSTEPWTWLRLQRNTRSTAGQTNSNQRTIRRKWLSVIITHLVIPQKVQICYLEELVTREKVGGRLQDGCHGFSELLVHCSAGGGRVWLSLEYKLYQTHAENPSVQIQFIDSELLYMACEFYLHIWSQVVFQPLLMALRNNVNHDSEREQARVKGIKGGQPVASFNRINV